MSDERQAVVATASAFSRRGLVAHSCLLTADFCMRLFYKLPQTSASPSIALSPERVAQGGFAAATKAQPGFPARAGIAEQHLSREAAK
jgi:hypothetical protein